MIRPAAEARIRLYRDAVDMRMSINAKYTGRRIQHLAVVVVFHNLCMNLSGFNLTSD